MILIGLGPSAFDISREIAQVAREVHVATRLNPDLAGMKFGDYGNIMFHTTVCIRFFLCRRCMRILLIYLLSIFGINYKFDNYIFKHMIMISILMVRSLQEKSLFPTKYFS